MTARQSYIVGAIHGGAFVGLIFGGAWLLWRLLT